MKNSDLYQLVQSFSPIELREVRKFLVSPFFNQREDLVRLFEYLVETEEPEKEEAWDALAHPRPLKGASSRQGSAGGRSPSGAGGVDEPFDDQKIRLLMSYLHRLLERYLTVKQATSDGLDNRLHLTLAYRTRDMQVAFERNIRRLETMLEKQPLRDAHFHKIQERLQWERYQFDTARNPTDAAPLHRLAKTVEVAFLSNRLRVICMGEAQGGVYSADFQEGTESQIIQLAERQELQQLPAIAYYLRCYRMLREPEVEGNFQKFKSLLLAAQGQFTAEEMRELFTHAVNFCIRRINRGERRFSHEVMELYKSALASGYLLESGVLSRFTYHNIVAAALQTEELDWVESFLHEHKNSLPRRYRESSFSFNLARLEYARRNHDAVLELLQKANYRDLLLNLAAKTLLLKTYYDLDEHDLLQSHLDAMRNYIRRKRVIGYHRTNYLNINRYAERLLRLNFLDKKQVEKLQAEIAGEELLTEREWLLGRLK